MNITNEQKHLVQKTFGEIADTERLATRLYERLFEIDPTTQTLFMRNMAEQRTMLLLAISTVVYGINDIPAISPAIQHLSKRHVGYGVTLQHWHNMSQALMGALEDMLGTSFTPEVRDAWLAAYGVITQIVIDTAYPHVGNTSM